VQTFLLLWRRGKVKGLFLSSGMPENRIMDKMLLAVEALREKHGFKGYIHLKIIPGSDQAALEKAIFLANRVSVNLECPDARALKQICPEKDFEKDLFSPVKNLSALMKKQKTRCDQTTQFVVGAAGEKDRLILEKTQQLYRELKLSRVYYSAFQPPSGKLWENEGAPVDPWREIRL